MKPRKPAMRERAMKPYAQDEEEMPEVEEALEELALEELDFGDLPELGEEEIEEVAECPPGCVPEEEAEEDEEEEKEEGEEEGEEEEVDEEAEEAEEEDEEVKEASVEEETDDNLVFVLAEDKFDSVDARDLDFPIFDAEGENPHYLVLHEGEPVAKIALMDQELPEDHRGPFLSDKYTDTLRSSIARVGLTDTLKAVNAKVYAAQGSKSAIAAEMKKAAKEDMDQAFRANMANLQDNFMNTLVLAIEASNKNVLLENPLKESLVINMRKAGITERGAVELIERSFREKGADYFHGLVKKAEEWLGMPEEAQKQVISMVTTANYVHPADRMSDYRFEDEDEINTPEEQDAIPEMVPRNVPVQAVASPEEKRRTASVEDVRSELKGKLRMGSRLVRGGKR